MSALLRPLRAVFRGKADLRRACQRRLASLGAPGPRSTAELRSHISALRGRPIVTVPMKLKPPEPCGMWIAWPDVDVIVYAADTGHAYRNHIIVHELAHMLCGHRTADDLIGPGVGALFPDLAPQLVRDALHRSGYTDPQEREAEMIASLFLKQAPADPPEAAGEMPRADAEILARIEATIVGSRLPRPVGPGAPGQPG